MYKIMIIEDDFTVAEILKDKLCEWGFDAFFIREFNNIVEQFADMQPQLILLDVKLPFYNGFYWCSEIRKFSKVPIIFISSIDDNMNKVMSMNMGGDDYITKPFELSVLVAKVQALLRRTYTFQNSSSMIEHRGVVLLLEEAVLNFNGQKVELTKNEFRILKLLLENKGHPVSRKDLMICLWDNDCFVSENALEANVARLRKKLDTYGLHDWIVTKKGLGYLVEE